MSSHRAQQINENLRTEISEIFGRELEFPTEIMVTISKVVVGDNLKVAEVWVSVLPINKRSKIQNIIKKKKVLIQQILGKRLKMKPIPKLQYYTDFSTEKAHGIELIIDKALKEL